MKLRNNLYKIVADDAEHQTYELELLPDSLIYKAHFPEQPITPGVCILQIATELLEYHISARVELSKVANAKFIAVINPLETLKITYNFKKLIVDEESKSIKTSIIVNDKETIFAKLSLVYRMA